MQDVTLSQNIFRYIPSISTSRTGYVEYNLSINITEVIKCIISMVYPKNTLLSMAYARYNLGINKIVIAQPCHNCCISFHVCHVL